MLLPFLRLLLTLSTTRKIANQGSSHAWQSRVSDQLSFLLIMDIIWQQKFLSYLVDSLFSYWYFSPIEILHYPDD